MTQEEGVKALMEIRDSYRKGKEYKNSSRAKRKRYVSGMILQSLLHVPDEIREPLLKYWKEFPTTLGTEELIMAKMAFLAITENGHIGVKAAELLMNTAYGRDSVDSEVTNQYALPDTTKEEIKNISDALKDEYG